MSSPLTVAQQYLDAFHRKDSAALEPLLADDVRFEGPMMQISGKTEFLGAMTQMLQSWDVDFEFLQTAESGDHAALLYDFVMRAPVAQKVRMSEWYRVRDGRIDRMQLSFDTAKFTPPAGA